MSKTFFKRLFVVVLAMFIAMCSFSTLIVAVAEENEEIIVFSVEDYIDESILEDFEKEYGVAINYVTFATNEEMYNELSKDPYACDLMCPSEYMIMKLREEGMIKEFDTPENFKKYGSGYIKNVFKNSPLNLLTEDEEKTYAIGYMWGTLGMIYNLETLTEDEQGLLKNWNSIWTNFTNRSTIKDSIRDTYLMALAEVYYDELCNLKTQYENSEIDEKTYTEELTEIFNRTDAETVGKVGDSLTKLKGNIQGFEVDAGKSDILTGKIDVNVAWSGDAVYSLKLGLYDEVEGEDGEIEYVEKDEPVLLGYMVPEEGSNIWFDGYVMTKYADEENSLLFLNYLADPEIAVKNMDYTGYTSCIAGDAVFDYVLEMYDCGEEGGEKFDLSYFFNYDGTGESEYIVNVDEMSKYMFIAQYPTKEITVRCAVMQNFSGDALVRINEMWKKVKLVTLPWGIIIAIAVVIILVLVLVVVVKYVDKDPTKETEYKKKTNRDKIVKIEKIL